MPTRTESNTEALPSGDAKGTETTVSPVKVDPTEEAMRGSVEASGAKIPELISSSRAQDWSSVDGIPAEPEGDGLATSVPDPGMAPGGDEVEAGVLESRPGTGFKPALVVRSIRQSGEIDPAQLMNQNDLTVGGSEQHEADAKPASPQAVDVGGTGVGTVDQPDVHNAQARHDTSGQVLKAAQVAGAAPRNMEGAAGELVRAGQAAGIQRRSVPADGSSSKSNAAAEPSSREAVMQHAADASTSRMLTNAMRGELHVGLHTEAFGRVTIQTNTALGQFSAQVSLEDSKQSAALAAHFPAVEQRILQEHGLDASVRIVSESHSATGGNSTGNSQHGSGANDETRGERRSGRAFEQSIGGRSRVAVGEIASERAGRNAALGRLDVTV
ncbi:MAG TPA: hypothetical protein VGU25_00290 [Acidobacteriaceae bacterium]|nr:hypothetical protein [Acidobacteriaceae bacterium]